MVSTTGELTGDQRLFASTTRDFLARTVPVSRVRELSESPVGFERDWWVRGAELGWTAMLVPERLGGGSVSGAPMSDLAVVAGEMGRACAPGPLLTTSAVLTGLVRAGEPFAERIGEIVSGETVAAWAFYRPARGLGHYGVQAEPDGDGYRLSGEADRVECGDQADVFLVTAHSPDGLVQVLVPADAPGVTVTRVWTLDLVRHTASVRFADVRADSVVQRGKDAEDAVEAQLQTAAVLSAAEMAEAAERTFEFTVQWMFDRYSFGRPLASYQALKHRMADNKTWLEACLATSAAAARTIDEDPSSAPEAVSTAKSYVGAKAPVIVQDCVQLHGGIGVTWEHDIHLYLRRVTLGRALYGTPEEHRRLITDLLTRSAA
ncbi:acyl-CoA dehydrogenase [Amycolatopsis acidicola]|uniref:Acyl-CoA dehydrogenase n=1 Tax=Amycolatopsis acidicola TaxID=2596893 RepID=A0A5N0UM88_9PSEU|nr:acyl-CoA dehydrogenase family protein [Amycolatopsis acidicola]KAA9149885.1 acyl-CoA dehydrogenase [Amycolatopsis acidicola]